MSALNFAALTVFFGLVASGAPSCAPPADSGAAGTVTGTEYERDSNNPTTGTHYADCTTTDGSQYRVIITEAAASSLRTGQPCPAGPHVPTARQQHSDLYDELTKPLPYHGGDPNSPCGSWSAATQADADQMRATWDQCMTSHH